MCFYSLLFCTSLFFLPSFSFLFFFTAVTGERGAFTMGRTTYGHRPGHEKKSLIVTPRKLITYTQCILRNLCYDEGGREAHTHTPRWTNDAYRANKGSPSPAKRPFVHPLYSNNARHDVRWISRCIHAQHFPHYGKRVEASRPISRPIGELCRKLPSPVPHSLTVPPPPGPTLLSTGQRNLQCRTLPT